MNVQLARVGLLEELYIPPPPVGRVARERAVGQGRAAGGVVVHPAAVALAELPSNVQSVRVGLLEELLYIPPPRSRPSCS